MDNSVTIWRLIARVLNEEATSKEQQELFDILRQDESLQQQFDILSRVWKEKHGSVKFEDHSAAQSTISRIINKAESEGRPIEMPARQLSPRRIWMAAASILILATAGWYWASRNNSIKSQPGQETIEARHGSRSRSILPDGTTVWLNAGSTLSYVSDFSGATREVRLEGEAFFDVVKQPGRPFIVHTSGIDVKVLGTAFNIKSYPGDKTVETTLYRGSVKVFRQEGNKREAILLKPNEKLIWSREAAIEPEQVSEPVKTAPVKTLSPDFTIATIDSTKKESERFETAWVYSRLEFRGDSFEELAKKLERWYNVTIVFNDERVKQLNFNGSFERETVEQAFEALKSAVLFNYTIKNHEIYVGSVQ